jgi:hypothetical protein
VLRKYALKIMDIEFHYYINYVVALQAGLLPDIAHKIAYSAQYVDDNTENYAVLKMHDLTQYNNITTQSFNINLSIKEIMSIYPIFHFIPGDNIIKTSSLRRDGECRYMATIPDSKIAKNALKHAIKSNNPYWIGIVSHAYADTWAHQNFTGLKDSYNCVDKNLNNKLEEKKKFYFIFCFSFNYFKLEKKIKFYIFTEKNNKNKTNIKMKITSLIFCFFYIFLMINAIVRI